MRHGRAPKRTVAKVLSCSRVAATTSMLAARPHVPADNGAVVHPQIEFGIEDFLNLRPHRAMASVRVSQGTMAVLALASRPAQLPAA